MPHRQSQVSGLNKYRQRSVKDCSLQETEALISLQLYHHDDIKKPLQGRRSQESKGQEWRSQWKPGEIRTTWRTKRSGCVLFLIWQGSFQMWLFFHCVTVAERWAHRLPFITTQFHSNCSSSKLVVMFRACFASHVLSGSSVCDSNTTWRLHPVPSLRQKLKTQFVRGKWEAERVFVSL